MHKLGLIGGTGPESTLLYYRELTHRVEEKSGALPPLVIESLSVYRVLEYCQKNDDAGLAAYLLDGINNLARAGAEAATLTGITPHRVFDRLQAASPLPLISMLDVSAAAAVQAGYSKLLLLGTGPTMAGTFARAAFEKRGIEVVVPTPDQQATIHHLIATELERGIIRPASQERLLAITRAQVAATGAQAVVLGCTELPLAFAGKALPVPVLDVLQVHLEQLVKFILAGEIKD